jgi:hypothetical protein
MGSKGSQAPSMDMSAYTNSMNQMNQAMMDMNNRMNEMLSEDWQPDIPEVTMPEFDAGEELDWGTIGESLTEQQKQAFADQQAGKTSRNSTILTDSLLDDEDPLTSNLLG